MKVAIPLFDTRVSPRFAFAREVLLATVENGQIRDSSRAVLVDTDPYRRVKLLATLGVRTVICGGINGFYARLLAANNISLVPWVTGEAEHILRLYAGGQLKPGTVFFPGGRRGQWGFCRRRGRGGWGV